MILAGDVGGTKVALALVEHGEGEFRILREERYATEDFDGLAPVVERFLADAGERPDRACFGVAAPVVDESVAMTNLDWKIDRERLARATGIPHVVLINDLAAAAWGIDALSPDGFETLSEGEPQGPTAGLIAAGTGLGMAILTRAGGRDLVLPSEGGHQAFAPRIPLEEDLLAFLRGRFPDHVSIERVVSGSGIEAIYAFLRETGREAEPPWLAERLAASADRSEEISRVALAGEAAICEATMDAFIRCFASAAGDLALTIMALRGVYLAGGIAPAIVPLLRDGGFLDAFRAKGRFQGHLERVPVKIVLDLQAPLLGAARRATIDADPFR
ncbi:MAG TPA: glucokinase [Gemmatimonadota bacterium]|nr:glucokinase [Gemmatimonadota bacterium]